MDIKNVITEAVKKVTTDKDFAANFEKDPAKALEELTGMDLPDNQVNQVVAAIKSKANLSSAADLLGGLFKK